MIGRSSRPHLSSADCTTAIAIATRGRTRATGRAPVGQTVLDTQLSANQFYTLDKQHELTKYKPTRLRSAGLHGRVLPVEERLPDAAREHRRLSAAVEGRQSPKRRDDELQGSSTRRRCEARTRCAAASTFGRRCAAAWAAATPPVLTFTRDYTRQASDEALLTPSNLGLSLAAFMLGVPTTIQIDDQVDASLYNHFVGAFAQDTWRMSRNLTINAGLRFEYEDGIREKDDRMLVGFDPDAMTSISQAAEAAYLASGIANTPGMLPSISVRGGSVFATDPGQHGTSWKGQAMWMPRVSGRLQAWREDGSQGRVGSLLRHAERG